MSLPVWDRIRCRVLPHVPLCVSVARRQGERHRRGQPGPGLPGERSVGGAVGSGRVLGGVHHLTGAATGWRAGKWHRLEPGRTLSKSASLDAGRGAERVSEVSRMAQQFSGVPPRARDPSLPEPAEPVPGPSCLSQLLGVPACTHPISTRLCLREASALSQNPFSFLVQAPAPVDSGPTYGIQDGHTRRPLT